jgi:hypothetical protein
MADQMETEQQGARLVPEEKKKWQFRAHDVEGLGRLLSVEPYIVMGGTVALLLMIVIANVANDTDFTFPLAHTAIGFSVYSIICTIYLWSNGK